MEKTFSVITNVNDTNASIERSLLTYSQVGGLHQYANSSILRLNLYLRVLRDMF